MHHQHRVRLAVLDAVARTPTLFRAYVLKGSLALHFAYGGPRRSDDLDFNAVEEYFNEITGDVKAHSAEAYGAIAANMPPRMALPPFEQAYVQVRAFVYSLDLPA